VCELSRSSLPKTPNDSETRPYLLTCCKRNGRPSFRFLYIKHPRYDTIPCPSKISGRLVHILVVMREVIPFILNYDTLSAAFAGKG